MMLPTVSTALTILAATAACLLALLAAAPPRTPQGTRGADRRLRWVDRHPHRANLGDIASLLRRDGASRHTVDLVVERARSLGIAPLTMWVWVRQYDVASLAVAVAADLTHAEMLAHLGAGTRPDIESLEVLAGLNGLVMRPAPSGRIPTAHAPRSWSDVDRASAA